MLGIWGPKCVTPDDILSYNLNEFSFQIESESKLVIQNLKEAEEMEICTIIEKWSQMEYDVRDMRQWCGYVQCLTLALFFSSVRYVHEMMTSSSSKITYFTASGTGSSQPWAWADAHLAVSATRGDPPTRGGWQRTKGASIKAMDNKGYYLMLVLLRQKAPEREHEVRYSRWWWCRIPDALLAVQAAGTGGDRPWAEGMSIPDDPWFLSHTTNRRWLNAIVQLNVNESVQLNESM